MWAENPALKLVAIVELQTQRPLSGTRKVSHYEDVPLNPLEQLILNHLLRTVNGRT